MGFALVMDMKMEEFLSDVRPFKEAILNVSKGSGEMDSVTLTKLEDGSVKVEGSVQATSKSEGEEIYSSLDEELSSTNTLMGYSIMEMKLEKRNIDDEDNNNQPT